MKEEKQKEQELFLQEHLPAILFLLQYGAGTLFAGLPELNSIINVVKIELKDGKEFGGEGDWGYEIAKMVEQKDTKRIFQTIKDITQQMLTNC
ncbi:MAG: hypothetical protein NC833_06200 [Candidatus Omnitrophica bacterium]|nr:hypothetical protein [Candidatus Omnitrophota bacterium]